MGISSFFFCYGNSELISAELGPVCKCDINGGKSAKLWPQAIHRYLNLYFIVQVSVVNNAGPQLYNSRVRSVGLWKFAKSLFIENSNLNKSSICTHLASLFPQYYNIDITQKLILYVIENFAQILANLHWKKINNLSRKVRGFRYNKNEVWLIPSTVRKMGCFNSTSSDPSNLQST